MELVDLHPRNEDTVGYRREIIKRPGTPSCVLCPAGSPFLPDRTPDPVRLTLSLFESLSWCFVLGARRKNISRSDTFSNWDYIVVGTIRLGLLRQGGRDRWNPSIVFNR